MNMHILSFNLGGSHAFAETHVQERVYFVGRRAISHGTAMAANKKDDFMCFDPYVPQCPYGVGREPFAYIYFSDCNKDAQI
ncbi:hypothetical protein [Pectinatus frisingensis]|uniref:hypothetical protein n=1 Tax=Pectinatus frisingensis TaxID=865 RepID=UPI0018C649B8|nr:hypothetical protein [Pectinatus frisingensis]